MTDYAQCFIVHAIVDAELVLCSATVNMQGIRDPSMARSSLLRGKGSSIMRNEQVYVYILLGHEPYQFPV